MKRIILVLAVLTITAFSNAQPADGSTATDFTLTNRQGTVHNLYTYLDQGKAVFLKFFACHCPSCWAYHNTHRLDSLYDIYGPNGTDQVMVLMLEYDQNNPEAFTGGGSYTQGDWTLNNSVPMIDVEGSQDRMVFDDYNLQYYPMIIRVCPDKKTKLMSTSYNVSELFQEADDCPGSLGITEEKEEELVFVDQINKQLNLRGFDKVSTISIFNIMGQKTLEWNGSSTNYFDVSTLSKGMYVVQLQHSTGTYSKKVMIE